MGLVWVWCFPSCTNPVFPCHRTLTQEDPGDNQITLEEVVQMVNTPSLPACPSWLGVVQGEQPKVLVLQHTQLREQRVSKLSARGARQGKAFWGGVSCGCSWICYRQRNSSQPTGTVLPCSQSGWRGHRDTCLCLLEGHGKAPGVPVSPNLFQLQVMGSGSASIGAAPQEQSLGNVPLI